MGKLSTPTFREKVCTLEMTAVRNRPEAYIAGLSHVNSVNDLKRTIIKFFPKITGTWKHTRDKDLEDANTVVVKEPVSEKYYRLTSYEIQLLKELDGTVNIERAVERLKGRGHYYSMEDANGIVVKSAQYGLVVGTRFDTADYLRARTETVDKARRAALFSSVYFLFIRVQLLLVIKP